MSDNDFETYHNKCLQESINEITYIKNCSESNDKNDIIGSIRALKTEFFNKNNLKQYLKSKSLAQNIMVCGTAVVALGTEICASATLVIPLVVAASLGGATGVAGAAVVFYGGYKWAQAWFGKRTGKEKQD